MTRSVGAYRIRIAHQSEPLAALSAAAEQRDSGITVIGKIPWGSHICMFYGSKDDLIDSCVSYFEAGLKSGELCIWVVSDQITERDAIAALCECTNGFTKYMDNGQIEFLDGQDWYLKDDRCDTHRILDGWLARYDHALEAGYEGLRVSGSALWTQSKHWTAFREYEHEVNRALMSLRMLGLCTYSLSSCSASDVLDVADAHQCSIARRNGKWEFLETPELKRAKSEIGRLTDALESLSRPFPNHESLTPRERLVLAHVIRGSSSKEIGRILNINYRTVEFHRSNIMKKLDARNAVDLARLILNK